MVDDNNKHPVATRRRVLQTSTIIAGAGLAGCGEDSGENVAQDESDGNGNGDDGGNGGSTSRDSGGKEITVISGKSGPDMQNVWQDISSAFEEETGHTVDLQFAPFGAQAVEQISSMVRAGDAPEVFWSSGGTAGALAAADLLLPVGEVHDELYSSSQKEDVDHITFRNEDGEPQNVVTDLGVYGWMIRKDVLEEAGADFIPEKRYTFEGFDDREQLTTWIRTIDENTDYAGMGYSHDEDSRGANELFCTLAEHGAGVFGGSTEEDNVEVILDQGENKEKAVEALSYTRDERAPHGEIGPHDWTEMQELYAQDRVGMVYYRPGRWISMLLDREMEEKLRNTMVYPNPQFRARDDGYTQRLSIMTHTVQKGSENPEVGKEFIEFFMTHDLYADFLYANPLDAVPPTGEGLEDPRFAEYEDTAQVVIDVRPEFLEYYKEVIDRGIGQELVFAEPGPGANPVWSQASVGGEVGRLGGYVLSEGMDPGEACDQVAGEIRDNYM